MKPLARKYAMALSRVRCFRKSSVALFILCVSAGFSPSSDKPSPADAKKAAQNIKEVAGTAEFLRSVPKHFATLNAVDPVNRRVTLLVSGDTLPKVWTLCPDAEVKVSGWWGRLTQFKVGDRVWVWFKTDRNKQPVAVSMLADELSQQDIHGSGVVLEELDKDSLTLKVPRNKSRKLKIAKDAIRPPSLKAGDKIYVQSSSDFARIILSPAGFAARRSEQQALLRNEWTHDGLPGTIAFLHIFSGELDFMLDHEAMRWGRSLKRGDKVKLQAVPPIAAVVKDVRPWRERTQLRLVVNGVDQADLTIGQRLAVHMDPPPIDIDKAVLPPDLDRPRSKDERVEWFLASIYCTCGVAGDTCTGHFYTLASCNPNGCGMPNMVRKDLAGRIAKGLTDKQIFEELLKEQGPALVRPHLMP
jgi:hypothetical protein